MPLGRYIAAFRSSFRLRLFLFFTLLTALVTTAFFSFYVIHEIRSYRGQLKNQAHLLAELLATNLKLPLYAGDLKTVQLLVEGTAQRSGVSRVTVTGPAGIIVADMGSSKSSPYGEEIVDTADVAAGPLSPDPASALLGEDLNQPKPVFGKVSLEMDTGTLAQRINTLAATSAVSGFFFWLVASVFGYLALRRLTTSFRALMEGVQQIEGGDYTVSIADDVADEPGRAARAINALAETLRCREIENQRLQEELLNAMRLEVREEKQQLMARLIQTNRMTSLGLLVSSMSHEINNPNATIALSAHYLSKVCVDVMPLLNSLTEEEGDFCLGGIPFSTARYEMPDCVAKILTNSDRIAQVVQDLRAYALGLKNEFTPDVDLNGVVLAALTIIRCQTRQSDVCIKVQNSDDLPLIAANQQQLEQVVINLLMNALQASAHDVGDILIATSFDREAGEVLITVMDQGEGIARDAMQQLLEPFYSTRIDQGGSGLGLYIANYIVGEHKGRLEFESEQGEGTTVKVRLPLDGGGGAARAVKVSQETL